MRFGIFQSVIISKGKQLLPVSQKLAVASIGGQIRNNQGNKQYSWVMISPEHESPAPKDCPPKIVGELQLGI